MKSESVDIAIRLFNLALVVQATIVFEYEEETKKITGSLDRKLVKINDDMLFFSQEKDRIIP